MPTLQLHRKTCPLKKPEGTAKTPLRRETKSRDLKSLSPQVEQAIIEQVTGE